MSDIWTPPEPPKPPEPKWHTGTEEVWTIPAIGSEYIYCGKRPVAMGVWPEDANRICACLNALAGIPTMELHAVNRFDVPGDPYFRWHRLAVCLSSMMEQANNPNETP